MMRPLLAFAGMTVLGITAAGYGRSHPAEDPVDRVQGVRLATRLHCDGATNPQEDLKMATTFSPGGLQRSFHLDIFESQYCKHLDMYFFCAMHGHDKWKHEWVQGSQGPAAAGNFWIDTCAAHGSTSGQEYILSGWYQEGAGGRKAPWKQAAIKQVSATPEVYEFSDPNGGTARVEIERK